MKTKLFIKSFIFTVLFLITLISCNLDEYNPAGDTAENIWSTPQGFQTLVNAAYSNLRTFLGKEDGVLLSEAGTDIWFRAGKSTSYRQLFRYQDFTPENQSSAKNYWRDLWPGVNICNAGINIINEAGFTSEKKKNEKLGELKFLRAFYYYHIVETWGGVMLLTKESTYPVLEAKREPVEKFYDLMISDLEFACQWLPVNPEKSYEVGRATKKAAMGFLAKIYLTRAYYSKDVGNIEDANSYFSKASNMAQATIDSCAKWGVKLYDNYADLWKNGPPINNNKNCKEALFVVANSTNISLNYDANGNRLHLWFMPKYDDKPGMQASIEYGNTGEMRFMPTKFLLDLFDETKDSRYEASFREVWLCNRESGFTWTASTVATWGKDPSIVGQKINFNDTALLITKHSIPDKKFRKYVVVDRDSMFQADTIRTTINIFPHLIKFNDPNRASATIRAGYNDIIVMRLAEMYMIAAEAEFQLGNKDKAAEYINVLRRRAAKPGKTNEMEITANEVNLDFILDEWAREFAGEHMRWFVLKRTRTLVDRIDRFNKDIKIPENLRRKDNGLWENVLLRPIRQDEIDALLNKDEFPQNPGY